MPQLLTIRTNAGGQVQKIEFDGKSYLSIPVVSIKEGVWNGELVPGSELEKSVPGWNGRPVILDHPKIDGQFVSANIPEVLSQTIGMIQNARWEDNKLKFDAWVELEENRDKDFSTLIEKITKGQLVEGSTGYFRDLEESTGMVGGKSYIGIASNLIPDHYAFLLKDIGACSIKDGCGAPRVNEVMMETQTEVNPENVDGFLTVFTKFITNILKKEEIKTMEDEKTALIGKITANQRNKLSPEALGKMSPCELKTLAEMLEDAPAAEVPAETPEPEQPIQDNAGSMDDRMKKCEAMIASLAEKMDKFGKSVKANTDQEKAQLITQLTANQQQFTGEELAAMELPQLRKLDSLLTVPNYGGRRFPQTNAGDSDWEPYKAPEVTVNGQ